jgi:hypothetical protein
MKEANLALFIGLAVVVVLFKIFTRGDNSSAPNPAQQSAQLAPAAAPVLPSSSNDPLTEAAYNQQPTDFAPALGATENTGGDEPLGAL